MLPPSAPCAVWGGRGEVPDTLLVIDCWQVAAGSAPILGSPLYEPGTDEVTHVRAAGSGGDTGGSRTVGRTCVRA
eukprot:6480426-Prymnesium_polylepis.2